jgi:glycosyltransferase involved in cell wall biosynthesis
MAERECEQIRLRYPTLPCVFIPHGIDVDFWRPISVPPRRQVCAVGRYLRNFPMFLRVSRSLLARYPDLTIRWLVNPDFQLSPDLAQALPSGRFELARHLSAAQLHQFYVESWLFFTPYDNVTASNAIVESMACGIPVFTTHVGGMASYAGADAITMLPNNDDNAMLAAVSRCLDSAEIRSLHAHRGRQHAEARFSWPRIVSAHEAYYGRLLGQQERLPLSGTDRDGQLSVA